MKGKVIVFFILFSTLISGAIQSPQTFFGFALGTDRQLARYDRIAEYFHHIDRNSPRVKVQILGKTTLDNDLILGIISSEENLNQLSRYQEISQNLSLAKISQGEARALAREGKATVFITCNLHSTEIASSQMAPRILYDFAVSEEPEIKEILDQVIFVLIPSLNPDGQIMVVDWYRKYQGTEFEGGRLPTLYHWYAGHDNNRDWFKQNLAETRLVSRAAYFQFFPQIWVDEHQMGSSGDRFFVPPFQDPPTPSVHPLVWRTINLIGTRIGFDLQLANLSGVASRGFFTGWWIGAVDDTAWFHNIPGILFEAASVKIATPIYIEPEEVRSGESSDNSRMMFSPDPWTGGEWTLADILRYEYEGTLSVLKTAARNRENLLFNSYRMAEDQIQKGKHTPPAGWLIPPHQSDALTAEKLVQTLLRANTEVFRVEESVTRAHRYFPEGSFYIPMAQPYRAYVLNLLSVQHYPDLRNNPQSPPVLPYDSAGWTLQYGMGVTVEPVSEAVSLPLKPVDLSSVYQHRPAPDSGTYLVMEPRYNNTFAAVFQLLEKGVAVYRDREGKTLPAGAFLVSRDQARPVIDSLSRQIPLKLSSRDQAALSELSRLKKPRVGVYQNWGGNMREGWMRYVLDEFRIGHQILHNQDIQSKGLASDFDVLIFNDVSKSRLHDGKVPPRYRRWYSPLPEKYRGGIGDKGFDRLVECLKKGKTLIFMGASCGYAIEKFNLPVTNRAETQNILCPNSYLRTLVKPGPLTFGMGKRAMVMFDSDTPFFQTSIPNNVQETRRTALVFPKRDLLASGWLGDEKPLIRKSLVVNCGKYDGNVILIGPDIVHRGQSEGTYRILFNALLLNAGR